MAKLWVLCNAQIKMSVAPKKCMYNFSVFASLCETEQFKDKCKDNKLFSDHINTHNITRGRIYFYSPRRTGVHLASFTGKKNQYKS